MLERRELPPEDIAALLRWVGGGAGDTCGDEPQAGLTRLARDPTPAAEQGESFSVCIGTDGPVASFRLVDPNGQVVFERDAGRAASGPYMLWVSLGLRSPVGTYTFEARAGDDRVQTFTLVVANVGVPAVMRDPPVDGPRSPNVPGGLVGFDLGGFPPNAVIRVPLYVRRGGPLRSEYAFATMLPALTADNEGRAKLEITTAATDRGCFLVVPQTDAVVAPYMPTAERPWISGGEPRAELDFCLSAP